MTYENLKERNIYPNATKFLGRDVKEELLGQHGVVLWIYGLSGSGKSTIANLLERTLHLEGTFTASLDGDVLRAGLNANLGFSDEDREENVRRVAETAKLCAGLGFVVLVSLITPRRALRKLAADIVGDDFHEVYLRAAFDTCAERDPKGLYAKAKVGALKQFTGKDSGFEEPVNGCMILDTEAQSAEECVLFLRDYINRVMRAGRAD